MTKSTKKLHLTRFDDYSDDGRFLASLSAASETVICVTDAQWSATSRARTSVTQSASLCTVQWAMS